MCNPTAIFSNIASFIVFLNFHNFYKREITTSQEKPEVKPQTQKKPEFIDLTSILPEFTKKKGVLLCNSGDHFLLDSNEKLTLIAHSTIFLLSDEENFKYSFSLHDYNKKLLYKKTVNTELNYHIDEQQNVFKWLDFTGSTIQLLAIKFDSFGITKNLKFLMNQCLFESNRKEYLKEAIKKGDEMQFTEKFLAQEPMEIEEEILEEFNKGSGFTFKENFSFFKNQDNTRNRTFTQAKVLDRTFLNKGPIISVFKTEDEDENKLEVF